MAALWRVVGIVLIVAGTVAGLSHCASRNPESPAAAVADGSERLPNVTADGEVSDPGTSAEGSDVPAPEPSELEVQPQPEPQPQASKSYGPLPVGPVKDFIRTDRDPCRSLSIGVYKLRLSDSDGSGWGSAVATLGTIPESRAHIVYDYDSNSIVDVRNGVTIKGLKMRISSGWVWFVPLSTSPPWLIPMTAAREPGGELEAAQEVELCAHG